MSKPIKVAITGVGRAGWNMHTGELGRFSELFTIAGACDIEADRCKMMADKYGCPTYPDIRQLVKDPNIELVSIATRSPEHTPHALLALKAGKYVFLEKPIALTYRDALKLQKAAQEYPGKLFFRHNRRFEPAFQHIREIIASGVLGEVFQIKLRRHGYQRRNDWQTLIDCGGGQLNNWGPHIIDHALRFLESPVAEMWSDLKRVAAVGDAEDHLKIVLKGENGRVVDLEISGGAAISEPVYLILGTKGALVCPDEKEIKLRYLDPAQKLPAIQAEAKSPPLEASFGNSEVLKWKEETFKVQPALAVDTHHIWKYLHDAIRHKRPYPITTEEAVAVVRVTDQVKRRTEFAQRRKK